MKLKSPDGDVIDCIKRYDQPAFRHPLLKHHQIEEPPVVKTYWAKEEAENDYKWQVWHSIGTGCPDGSIPIQRRLSHPNKTPDPRDVNKDHEHALGLMRNLSKIYGTQATMNVWKPKVEGSEEFSLGQIWLTSGTYLDNNLNSIEAGWQTDTYNQTGCYNLRCGGFVQTSKKILVGGAITQTSISGGTQVELTIRIWKDQKLGSWWLGIIMGHGILEPVGYWPALLFTLQTEFAEKVEWGGEIVNGHSLGRNTSTQMGSGCLSCGIRKAAYMSNLQIALSEKNFEPVQDLALAATSPDYRAKKLNNTFFYYGGPEQIKSGGANLMLTTTSLRLFRRRRSTLPKTFIAKNGTVMLTFIPCVCIRTQSYAVVIRELLDLYTYTKRIYQI
ncbi:hypothetical protein YC2023_100552 [Brassica napus]